MKRKTFLICTMLSVLLFMMSSTMDDTDNEHIDVIDKNVGNRYILFV